MFKPKYKGFVAGILMVGLILSSTTVLASSHREAPVIAGDPRADATDVFAFVSPENDDFVTLIANYLPFQEPAGGPNFYPFDDNVLYEIKVDNDGDAKEDISYQFRFKTTIANPNSFLYNTGAITSLDDGDWNAKQTYTVTKVSENGGSQVIATDVPTPPANIGPKSTPNYGDLHQQAIRNIGNGGKVFAGQVDDPFFVELGGLFDLLTIRKLPGNEGGGVDGLMGYNVNALALQIPITELTSNGSMPASATDAAAVIGVWTTSSRQATRVLNSDGTSDSSGEWVQVSRLGHPLVNEVVVPLGAKDIWNGSKPINDAQFANGVTDPELGKLLKALYNVQVPPQGAFGTPSQRDDLVSIFLTGIPGLTKPANVTPSEQLRLNVAVAPTTTPNRMGVLAGDNAGFPNGRRLADDVTDIEIQAVAGAVYPLFHPEFTPDPLATKLGDGVDSNDKAFRNTFPYLALPHSGFESVPHSGSSVVNGLMNTISLLKTEIQMLKDKIASLMGNGGNNNGGGNGNNGGNNGSGNNKKYKATYSAELKGENVVPAISTTTAATGNITLKVADDEQRIDFDISTSNISGVTNINLACANQNKTGPTVASLFSATSTATTTQTISGQITDSTINKNLNCNPGISTLSHLIQAMREGKVYVDVKTTAFPEGQIRGQVK